jgi:hypothetical protein
MMMHHAAIPVASEIPDFDGMKATKIPRLIPAKGHTSGLRPHALVSAVGIERPNRIISPNLWRMISKLGKSRRKVASAISPSHARWFRTSGCTVLR